MVELTYIVAPIFMVILLGKLLRYFLIPSDDVWHHINTITYWVLFPCLLFNKTSVIDFTGYNVGSFAIALVAGFLAAILFSYVGGKLAGLNAASLSSVLQGGGRHNSFLALAVMSQLYGEQGEMIGALAIAIMVTFSNVSTIIILTSVLSDSSRGKPGIFSEVIRNPFIVSIAIGLTFNYLGWNHVPVLSDFTAVVGKAGLAIALLCVGAGLQFVDARQFLVPTAISCVAKMLVLPTSVFFVARYFGLSDIMTVSAVIFATVPTSSTAYALAKYMGGDAPLMAAIISLQTLLAVIAVPMAIILVG